MKSLLILGLFLLNTLFLAAQTISPENLEKLIQLSVLAANNPNRAGGEFKKAVSQLRTPELEPIVEVLLAINKKGKKILHKEYLTKPSATQLQYWHVMDKISRNLGEEGANRPNEEVAKDALEETVDSRWLLHAYYRELYGGIGFLFNDKNLSKVDLDMEEYGLDETEKAIFFVTILAPLAQRFRVLKMMKNPSKLLEFASKMPTFNGKPYYEFTSFGFEDFQWKSAEGMVSYKEEQLGKYYGILSAHFEALAEEKQVKELRELYFNSIMFVPAYFEYAGAMAEDLKDLYKEGSK